MLHFQDITIKFARHSFSDIEYIKIIPGTIYKYITEVPGSESFVFQIAIQKFKDQDI
jgi:hypothetical protein